VPAHVQGDVRDSALLDDLFARHRIQAVIHFAALKAVGESVREPLRYYDNNVAGTVSLLQAMRRSGVRTLVFSSSATVYGDPAQLPIREDFPLSATNPYGWSKLMMEQVLADVDTAEPGQWRIARLRYFNPVGAHESGLIGEDPQGEPGNLLPYVAQVAAGQRASLSVYGNDYPTPDGTGVRDYIHVSDLAAAHVHALEKLIAAPSESHIMNCGYGRGYSVREVLDAVDRATNLQIERVIEGRRAGDPDALIADNSRILATLPWRPARDDLDLIVADALAWERRLGERG